MRTWGWIRIAAVTAVDCLLAYELLGTVGAAAIVIAVLIYAWLGEQIDLLKDGAVKIENLNEVDKDRMTCLREYLVEDVRRTSNIDLSGLRLHIVPSNVPNAFTYGFTNIALTRPALESCDDATLCAVLSHEASHLLCLDAVFKRIMFANVTALLLSVSVSCLISMSFLWIGFLVLAFMCGFFRGFFGIMLFRGVGKIIKGIYTFIQYGILFIYGSVMGFVSRNSEYRADSYSCRLGYGRELQYYLERFSDQQEQGFQSLHEILYTSHPSTFKRIAKIEQEIISTPSDRTSA